MKFNKAIYVFFALFFLLTKAGAAFNIHYCGGSIADISHIFEGDNGCGMDEMMKVVSPCETKKKSCCDDEVVVIQNTDQNPLVDTLQLSGDQFLAIVSVAVFFYGVEETSSGNNTLITYESRSHSPPLFQLYCSYTFYA